MCFCRSSSECARSGSESFAATWALTGRLNARGADPRLLLVSLTPGLHLISFLMCLLVIKGQQILCGHVGYSVEAIKNANVLYE